MGQTALLPTFTIETNGYCGGNNERTEYPRVAWIGASGQRRLPWINAAITLCETAIGKRITRATKVRRVPSLDRG